MITSRFERLLWGRISFGGGRAPLLTPLLFCPYLPGLRASPDSCCKRCCAVLNLIFRTGGCRQRRLALTRLACLRTSTARRERLQRTGPGSGALGSAPPRPAPRSLPRSPPRAPRSASLGATAVFATSEWPRHWQRIKCCGPAASRPTRLLSPLGFCLPSPPL